MLGPRGSDLHTITFSTLILILIQIYTLFASNIQKKMLFIITGSPKSVPPPQQQNSPGQPAGYHSTTEASPRSDHVLSPRSADLHTMTFSPRDHQGHHHVTSSMGGSSLGTGSVVSELETTDDEVMVRGLKFENMF